MKKPSMKHKRNYCLIGTFYLNNAAFIKDCMADRLEFFHNFKRLLHFGMIHVNDPERSYIYGIVFEIFQIECFQILKSQMYIPYWITLFSILPWLS